MTEEGEGEAGFVSDSTEPFVDDLFRLADGIRAEVCEFVSLEVAPYLFDRVEVRGVGRESFDHQPVALALDEGLHVIAAVRGQSVPDERDVLVGARLHPEHEGRIAAVTRGWSSSNRFVGPPFGGVQVLPCCAWTTELRGPRGRRREATGPFPLRELAFLDDTPFRVARRCGKRAVVALVQLTEDDRESRRLSEVDRWFGRSRCG